MKEELYKIIILLVFSLCFSLDEKFHSYDFVNVDVLPLENSRNNIGIRFSEVAGKNRVFFQTQNWIAENLYLQGCFSPPLKNTINVIYNLNIGYDKKVDTEILKNTIFDLGYYYKRFESSSESEFKWISMSVIFNSKIKNKNIITSYTYIYSNSSSNKISELFGTIDLFSQITKGLFLKYG